MTELEVCPLTVFDDDHQQFETKIADKKTKKYVYSAWGDTQEESKNLAKWTAETLNKGMVS